jgi:hypothetical protein
VLLPPWRGKGGMGGDAGPLMRTPTPPSPVKGEGLAPRLTTTLVPNSIDPPPSRGRGKGAMGTKYFPLLTPGDNLAIAGAVRLHKGSQAPTEGPEILLNGRSFAHV